VWSIAVCSLTWPQKLSVCTKAIHTHAFQAHCMHETHLLTCICGQTLLSEIGEMNIYIYLYSYREMHIHLYSYILTYGNELPCVHMCMWVWVCVYIYIYIYIYMLYNISYTFYKCQKRRLWEKITTMQIVEYFLAILIDTATLSLPLLSSPLYFCLCYNNQPSWAGGVAQAVRKPA
jgi:hypothetical protein